MVIPGPPRAEKLIFSDKTLACSNDSSPIPKYVLLLTIHFKMVFWFFGILNWGKCIFWALGMCGRRQRPVRPIDHLSRVIQSIDKISVRAVATKRVFCAVGGEKFFDLPARSSPQFSPSGDSVYLDDGPCWQNERGEIKRVCECDLGDNQLRATQNRARAL